MSRKFSLKFHAMFNTVILKGQVLGKVEHYFFKKEYQTRGAPHYHVVLWLQNAPVTGKDQPKQVLDWILQRITCRIPEEKTNPELHRLVTRYQIHKCSNYCKRKAKYHGAFVTRCKFGFPREVSDTGSLNSVEDCLKSRKKIYHLPRAEQETRVNDYSPLLLLLWKANMDIQFIAESSLALAHYVTGYVTKAERSNMQDLWQEIGSNKSVYSRLWSFGIRSSRSRECGLYEASDLLLGDHLCEKSDTVQWIDATFPHKRKHRLKDHSKLQELGKIDLNSTEIFEDSVIDTYYPQRPGDMEDVCLYDFVKDYVKCRDNNFGQRKYRRLAKPCLPNHRLFDPNKENEREEYFYSMLLLFVPFRNEGTLLAEGETAEEAFARLVQATSGMYKHHDRLQQMLKANAKVKEINEARQVEAKVTVNREDHREGPQIVGEATAAMNDVQELQANCADEISLEERIAMLNADQSRVFKQMSEHLLHQKKHECGLCECSQLQPLQMFVSGVGGTGKSFFIEAIRAQVAAIWKDKHEALLCAVAAPTGLAAFNVGGVTVHRLFQLPIEHEGKEAGYWGLPLRLTEDHEKNTSRCETFHY